MSKEHGDSSSAVTRCYMVLAALPLLWLLCFPPIAQETLASWTTFQTCWPHCNISVAQHYLDLVGLIVECRARQFFLFWLTLIGYVALKKSVLCWTKQILLPAAETVHARTQKVQLEIHSSLD